jgi:hypothetical protein
LSTPSEPTQDPATQEVLAVLGILMVGASTVATAAALSALTAIPPAALRASLLLQGWRDSSIAERPGGILDRTEDVGTAERTIQELNHLRQAAYTVKSGRRMQADLRAGWSAEDTAAREFRFFQMHHAAIDRRTQAARLVDNQAGVHGDLVGWYATRDRRTSAECARAGGANFRVSQPPVIGYPGTVHLYCRCQPGPPHATRRLV